VNNVPWINPNIRGSLHVDCLQRLDIVSERCVLKSGVGVGWLVLCVCVCVCLCLSVCLSAHVVTHVGTQQRLMMEWCDIAICCNIFLSCASLTF